MATDPSRFHRVNVTDTCSVWNVLASKVLHNAALKAGCLFCVTAFVRYELLDKPRKTSHASDQELKRRLRQEQAAGRFQTYTCTIDDLQAIGLLENRRALGIGELSSIAFALKINQGFLSDDRKAFDLAIDREVSATQNVPGMLEWLVFTGSLTDAEAVRAIAEHKAMGRSQSAQLDAARERAITYLKNIASSALGAARPAASSDAPFNERTP